MYAAVILLTIAPADCLSLMGSPIYARRELGTAALIVRARHDEAARNLALWTRTTSRDAEVRMRCVIVLRWSDRCPNCKGKGWWGHEADRRPCAACGRTGYWVAPTEESTR